MNKLNMKCFLTVALLGGIFFLSNCGGSTTTTTTTNTANNVSKPADTTKPADTAKPDAAKPETASTDSVGVPECDEYIKKYEACLTKIAKQAPQVEPSMKSAFQQQRDGFKQAAANPASKASLASTCKQAIETAKQSTASYTCEW